MTPLKENTHLFTSSYIQCNRHH